MNQLNVVVDECGKIRKEYLKRASVGYAPKLEEHWRILYMFFAKECYWGVPPCCILCPGALQLGKTIFSVAVLASYYGWCGRYWKTCVPIINYELHKFWQFVWWMAMWSSLFFTALFAAKMIVWILIQDGEKCCRGGTPSLFSWRLFGFAASCNLLISQH